MSEKFIFNELDKTKLVSKPLDFDHKNIINQHLIQQTLKDNFAVDELTNDDMLDGGEGGEQNIESPFNYALAYDMEQTAASAPQMISTETIFAETMSTELGESELTQHKQEPALDTEYIAKITTQAHKAGYDEALSATAVELNQLRERLTIIDQLAAELDILNYNYLNYEQGVVDLSLKIMSRIIHKLNKILPVNFVDILAQQLKQILSNNRIEAQLTVTYHSDNQAVFTQIFNDINLSSESKKHIIFEIDNSQAVNSCKVNYKDANLEFDEETIMNSFAEIIKNNFNIVD